MVLSQAAHLYTAFEQMPPAALKASLKKENIGEIKTNINQLTVGTQEMRAELHNELLKVQSSLATNGYTRWLTMGSAISTFSGLVINTIVHWDDNSLDNNLVQVGVMAGTVLTALHAAFVYYKTQKHTRQAQEVAAKQEQLGALLGSLAFLRESTKMAKRCTQTPENLQRIFPVFLSYMSTESAGIVPNSLASAWTETGNLVLGLNTVDDQSQLSAYIEGMVLPIIYHYTLVTEVQLKTLGYVPPPDDLDQVVVQ